MNRKLFWFYQMSISMILLFVSINILVKTVIWSFSLDRPKLESEFQYPISIVKGTVHTKFKYTTELKQAIFDRVEYLLTPAFTMLFVVLAVKLVKTPGILKEKDENTFGSPRKVQYDPKGPG